VPSKSNKHLKNVEKSFVIDYFRESEILTPGTWFLGFRSTGPIFLMGRFIFERGLS